MLISVEVEWRWATAEILLIVRMGGSDACGHPGEAWTVWAVHPPEACYARATANTPFTPGVKFDEIV